MWYYNSQCKNLKFEAFVIKIKNYIINCKIINNVNFFSI